MKLAKNLVIILEANETALLMSILSELLDDREDDKYFSPNTDQTAFLKDMLKQLNKKSEF